MRRAGPLETIAVSVPEHALEAYEAALASVGDSVSMMLADEDNRIWLVEAVRNAGEGDPALEASLTLAELATGIHCDVTRTPTEAEGWLARTADSFPEQAVGSRWTVRGTHLTGPARPGRITLVLDAGLAFGSGEHGSTRGCLRAFETLVKSRRPRRILDMGTGSGILAIAAAKLLRRQVLAVDNDPWSIRVSQRNASDNGVGGLVRARLGDGWKSRVARAGAPYDLVFANILARPLCGMARTLATHLAPGGTAILAGLLGSQAELVLAAHRRCGLVLAGRWREGPWTTLAVHRRGRQ